LDGFESEEMVENQIVSVASAQNVNVKVYEDIQHEREESKESEIRNNEQQSMD
jgi:hypothetical protein